MAAVKDKRGSQGRHGNAPKFSSHLSLVTGFVSAWLSKQVSTQTSYGLKEISPSRLGLPPGHNALIRSKNITTSGGIIVRLSPLCYSLKTPVVFLQAQKREH